MQLPLRQPCQQTAVGTNVRAHAPVRSVSRCQLTSSQSLSASLSLLSEVPSEEEAPLPRRCSGSVGTTGGAVGPCAAPCCRPRTGMVAAADVLEYLHPK